MKEIKLIFLNFHVIGFFQRQRSCARRSATHIVNFCIKHLLDGTKRNNVNWKFKNSSYDALRLVTQQSLWRQLPSIYPAYILGFREISYILRSVKLFSKHFPFYAFTGVLKNFSSAGRRGGGLSTSLGLKTPLNP